MQTLVTDIGNSDIVFGLYGQGKWIGTWRHPTAEYLTAADTLAAVLEHIEQGTCSEVVLSSVVPGLTHAVYSLLLNLTGTKPVQMSPDVYARLPIQIDNPWEIGSDLVANALYAHTYAKEAAVVVDFGTALTFTSVNKEGYVMGVAIAPGLRTAMRALSLNTAQLPQVPLAFPPSAVGKNTAHAIQAGLMHGYVGLVKEVLEQTIPELGEGATVFATGGLVSAMSPLHSYFDSIDPMLTLEGIRLAASFAGNK